MKAPKLTAFAMASAMLIAGSAMAAFYQWDDGTAENSLGLTAGGELAWMNVFTVDPVNGYLVTDIEVCFGRPASPGSSGVVPGQDFGVYLWGDNDGDPSTGATLLAEIYDNALAGQIDTDVLLPTDIPDIDVSAYDYIIVGASVVHAAGFFPAPMDGSTFAVGRSWAAGDSTGNFEPDGFAGDIGLIDIVPIGFNYTFMIRANAIPAPGALALLGLAGLVSRRRR